MLIRVKKKIIFFLKKEFSNSLFSKYKLNKNPIKLFNLNLVITRNFIGLTFLVHLGNKFLNITPTKKQVGFKIKQNI